MESGKHEKTIVSFKVWDREAEAVKLYALDRFIVEGESDGPHVVVNSGTHGDEFLAIDTAKKLYEELDPAEVQGTVSIIPEANIFACIGNARETPVPDFEQYESEKRNMNRCFGDVDIEGEPNGNITQRLAYHILKLVAKADHCLDLHTGTAPGHKIDHIRGKTNPEFGKDVLRTQDALIRASGLKYVIKSPASSIGSGVLSGVAPLHGVPTVTLEVGGGAYTEEELENYLQVCRNLLKEAGALPGLPETMPQKIYQDLYAVSSPTAGRYEPMKSSGDDVVKGEVLGRIQNEDGTHAVTCPYDGLVESVHRGDWVNEGTRVSFIAIKEERTMLEAVGQAAKRLLKRQAVTSKGTKKTTS